MPDFQNKSIYDEILEFAKQQAALGLLDSGVDTNFLNPILETLNSSVVNGSNIDDLVDELNVFITGADEGVGALQRYVTQVSNDSLTQFNATYVQTVTQDLGIEFYKYVGTKISNTRPFCVHHVNQYYHKREVENLGVGIEPTGKSMPQDEFKGRIPGTNKSNIFINRGGYNCRHQFSPISARFVPKEVLKRALNKGYWKPTKREKELLN
jgi:hypothetical protein